MRPAPLPDDMLQRETDRVEETRAMLAGLGCRDLARAVIADGPLAKILAKLGAAVDDREREYHTDLQPLTDSLKPGGCYEPEAMAVACFIMRQAKATT